ncbi:methylated-DNA--[protein]-cysteine S-methyltransferase [Bacteroides reticulotermitis]|uniref:methylated-DNA--[protein]-cysteine S-methyltransferase n=1 Tax=Bacteroides reticulotermitis TaxID=1133319 RepID=UPI003A83512E
MGNKIVQIQYYQSPFGELVVGSFEDKLCMCDWTDEKRRITIDRRIQKMLHAGYEVSSSDVIAKTIAQLDEYFARKRTVFDIPLLFVGTDFQKTVWQELLNIPYGKTLSYGALSQKLNNPKAIRAVASANGANPISILVPCHRVIGSDRKLIGYAGGLAAKRGLLELESNIQMVLF